MAFPPNFDNAWNEASPADTSPANQLGADIRTLEVNIRERLALLSGISANRPANMDAPFGGANYGILFFATDTGQIFQWNGTQWNDVSANVLLVNSGQTNRAPNIIASGTLNIPVGNGTLNFVGVNGPTGLFRISMYAVVTAITGAGINNVSLVLSWDDLTGSPFQSVQVNANTGFNIVGQHVVATQSFGFGEYCVFNTTGGTITLTYSTAANAGGTGTITVYWRVEYLG